MVFFFLKIGYNKAVNKWVLHRSYFKQRKQVREKSYEQWWTQAVCGAGAK